MKSLRRTYRDSDGLRCFGFRVPRVIEGNRSLLDVLARESTGPFAAFEYEQDSNDERNKNICDFIAARAIAEGITRAVNERVQEEGRPIPDAGGMTDDINQTDAHERDRIAIGQGQIVERQIAGHAVGDQA